MVDVRGSLVKWFGDSKVIEPGIYHYRRELADRMMRLHLRIDPDGSGLLTVNASGVLHLNETATHLMKLILDGMSKEKAISSILKIYKVKAEEVEGDYQKILDIVEHLETTEDACPILNVDVPMVPPFGKDVSAPYRADLALTYGCGNKCLHCYVSRDPKDVREMTLEQWREALDRLWDVGVPHICFTGGEATQSPHLMELIEKAEDLGMITGLLTNGRKLTDRQFVRDLCAAGLDHVQVTLESHDKAIHDKMVGSDGAFDETVQGIKNALDDDIYLITNTTLCHLNVPTIEETIGFIKELGVEQFAMNSFIYTTARLQNRS